MMCEHELKQALLDIEFLQECNNSVNLALSITRKELAAANERIAYLEDMVESITIKSKCADCDVEAQNKRMREALEMARPALVNADSDTSFIAHRYSHALTTANCPLTEAELLKTLGMCRVATVAVVAALEGKP